STCILPLLRECRWRRSEAYRERCARAAVGQPAIPLDPNETKQDKERESMGHPAHHHKINYIEFSTTDVARAKTFYGEVFGWEFQDWGPDYVGFSSETGGIGGGFRK